MLLRRCPQGPDSLDNTPHLEPTTPRAAKAPCPFFGWGSHPSTMASRIQVHEDALRLQGCPSGSVATPGTYTPGSHAYTQAGSQQLDPTTVIAVRLVRLLLMDMQQPVDYTMEAGEETGFGPSPGGAVVDHRSADAGGHMGSTLKREGSYASLGIPADDFLSVRVPRRLVQDY